MRRKSSPVFTVASVWLLPLIILMGFSQACDHAYKKADAPATGSSGAPDEVSLKADRAEYDKLRTDIPKAQRDENDELALILQSINKNSLNDEEPAKIRDRFSKLMRGKRAAHDKVLRTKRDEAKKIEKTKRDEFLNGLKEERATYMSRSARNSKPADRQAFFSGQEQKRQAFFSAESDRRREFESVASEERKTFEDSAREMTNKFNEEIRNYSNAFYERKKALALKKTAEKKAVEAERKARGLKPQTAEIPAGVTDEGKKLLKEFDEIPASPGVRLAPTDGN
jgi:hypothetical protein